MELSKTQKILLGVLSGWPIVYMFLFIAFIIALIAFSAGAPDGGKELDPFLGGGFVVLMVIHFTTFFLTMALMVFYIVHAVKNTRLDSNMRVIWIVLFFFGGMIAQPIYWYLQIWRKLEPTIGQLTSQPASSGAAHEEIRQGSYVPPNEPPDWR